MSNNTKLIMETWRRFINEGHQHDPGQYEDPDDHVEGEPLEGDKDLEEYNDDPYHEEYNPGGIGEDGYHDDGMDDGMHGGPTQEDRVESVYRRLLRNPQDPLRGFTEKEKELGRRRYEEDQF